MHQNGSKPIAIISGVVLALGGSFFAGVKLGQSNAGGGARGTATRFVNRAPQERQAQFPQFGGPGGAGQRGGRGGDSFATGEVLAKDDTSITLKLRDGGSKIIFYTPATSIMKNVGGSMADVVTGAQVSVAGTANQDGSISAKSVQLRPAAASGETRPPQPVE